MILEDSLIDLVNIQNPWWKEARFPLREASLLKRQLFSKFLSDVLETKQMISLTGLRRTGKSTLLKQVITYLLEKQPAKKFFTFLLMNRQYKKPLRGKEIDFLIPEKKIALEVKYQGVLLTKNFTGKLADDLITAFPVSQLENNLMVGRLRR